jgi:hypothetical protein
LIFLASKPIYWQSLCNFRKQFSLIQKGSPVTVPRFVFVPVTPFRHYWIFNTIGKLTSYRRIAKKRNKQFDLFSCDEFLQTSENNPNPLILINNEPD